MNKIKLIKFIDQTVGKLLVFLLTGRGRFQKNISAKIEKFLIIRPGGIGDAVLLLPAISLLRAKYPESSIDILCEKRNADIFGLSDAVKRVYLYDKGLGLLDCLKNKYDVAIDTEQWHRLSAVVSYLTGAPVRIGFDTNERGKLFTHQIPYSHEDYEVYSFFHLIEPLVGAGPEFNVDEPFIDIPSGVSSHLPNESKRDDGIVAIFPGASVKERRWGGERFGEVSKALTKRGYRIVILGSQADKLDAETIRRHAPASIDLTGKTNLIGIAAVLKECRLLITADSGLLHIACAVGTPTVSLFGSGIEKKWAPPGKMHIVLNEHLACSPCTKFGYTPKCKRDVDCLSSISVDELLHSADEILNGVPK